jgi:hypothetical protein
MQFRCSYETEFSIRLSLPLTNSNPIKCHISSGSSGGLKAVNVRREALTNTRRLYWECQNPRNEIYSTTAYFIYILISVYFFINNANHHYDSVTPLDDFPLASTRVITHILIIFSLTPTPYLFQTVSKIMYVPVERVLNAHVDNRLYKSTIL